MSQQIAEKLSDENVEIPLIDNKLFEHAIDQVTDNMKKDTYARFKNSELLAVCFKIAK